VHLKEVVGLKGKVDNVLTFLLARSC
jgi:hypothetical protein